MSKATEEKCQATLTCGSIRIGAPPDGATLTCEPTRPAFDRNRGSATVPQGIRYSVVRGNRNRRSRALALLARDLSAEQYLKRIAELVEAIIAKAAARRAETGIEPLGRAAVLRQHPFSQQTETKRFLAPPVHAASETSSNRDEDRLHDGWLPSVTKLRVDAACQLA